MPRAAVLQMVEIHEAADRLHDRLCQVQEWASYEQGVSQLMGRGEYALEDVVRRQEAMLETVRCLAVTLDTWAAMNQLVLERYLPDLVTMALEDSDF